MVLCHYQHKQSCGTLRRSVRKTLLLKFQLLTYLINKHSDTWLSILYKRKKINGQNIIKPSALGTQDHVHTCVRSKNKIIQ